ncbi:CopD family protein [Paenibacillus sp. KS-LC4]|uniref:copper resistance CopC/CopD family protein n=1 Tax=Paenibacillus sp. KS-LC4 TaxID=2979727 RepID=UPI0030CA8335
MIPYKLKINLLALAALLLFMLCNPALADAHANMERSTPLQDAELSESPSSIRIQYTEEFDPDLSRIVLEDEAGIAIKGKLSAEKDRWLVYTIPKLSPGIYKVKWQVLSVDTHVTDGSFHFAVGVPLATTKPSDTISLDGGDSNASPPPAATATAKPSASVSPSAGTGSASAGKDASAGAASQPGSGSVSSSSAAAGGKGGSQGCVNATGSGSGGKVSGDAASGGTSSEGKTNGNGSGSANPVTSAGSESVKGVGSDTGASAGTAEASSSSGQGGTSSVTEPGRSPAVGGSEIPAGSEEAAGSSKGSEGKSASDEFAVTANSEQQAVAGLDPSSRVPNSPTAAEGDGAAGEAEQAANESHGHSMSGDHGADHDMDMDMDGNMIGHSDDHDAGHQSDWRTVIYTLLRIVEVIAAACIAAFLYARYVLWSRADSSEIPRLLSKRSERLLFIGAALVLGATGFFHVWLLAEQLSAFDMGSGGALYQKILSTTMVGRAAWLRPALAALILLLAYAPQRDERWVAPLKWLMALLLTVLYPLTGHANASSLLSVAVLSHIVHIWTAAIWFGGILAIIGATWKTGFPSVEKQRDALMLMIKRFSQVALPIIILLAATGILLSLQRLNAWTELADSSYGRLVVLKTLLLAAVIGIGAYHRFSLMPRLAAGMEKGAAGSSSAPKFVQAVRIEALLALAAFIAAGILSSTAPPEQPAFAEPVYWHVMGDKAHMSMRIKPEEQSYQLDVWLPTGMGAPTLIAVQAKDDSEQRELRDIPFEFNKGGPDPYGYEGFDKYTYLSKAPVPAVGDIWDMTIVITDPTGEEHRYEKRIP